MKEARLLMLYYRASPDRVDAQLTAQRGPLEEDDGECVCALTNEPTHTAFSICSRLHTAEVDVGVFLVFFLLWHTQFSPVVPCMSHQMASMLKPQI